MPKVKDTAIPLPFLRACFDVDFETGTLMWKRRPIEHFTGTATRSRQHICNNWNALYAGTSAGTSDGRGYLNVSLNYDGKRRRKIHRIIWALATGAWPEHEIHHRNGVGNDNRLRNLREATRFENQHN
jgi:hypothetical protein